MYLYVYHLSCNMVLTSFIFLMCYFIYCIYCQNRSIMVAPTSYHFLFVTGWSNDWHRFLGHLDKQLKQTAWKPWKHCQDLRTKLHLISIWWVLPLTSVSLNFRCNWCWQISTGKRSCVTAGEPHQYEACSKSIRRDFFPRKLMKHGRCAMVGRWRVPSCACVDFFPPAYSVSCMQPACEWQCICSACCIVIFCENDGTTRAAVLHQILPEAWR